MQAPDLTSKAALVAALRSVLPPERASVAEELAQLIIGALESREAAPHLELAPDELVAAALRDLAGRQLRSDTALLTFGAANQLGDVTVSDLAGRDVVKLTVNVYGQQPAPQLRLPRLRASRPVLVGLSLTAALLLVLTLGLQLRQRQVAAEQTRIMVARFDGPDAQRYRVTETILAGLRQAVGSRRDVQVEALDRAFTEAEGAEVARAEALRHNADILIWGWYGATGDVAPLSVNFELLQPPVERRVYDELRGQVMQINSESLVGLTEGQNGAVQTPAFEELDSFTLQTELSRQLGYFSLLVVGAADAQMGRWQDAADMFSRALDQAAADEPAENLSQVYLLRGRVYDQLGASVLAGQDYEQAVRLDPTNLNALNNRGNLAWSRRNVEAALADYNRVLELEPDMLMALVNRGNLYLNLRKIDDARRDLERAVALAPDDPMAQLNYAVFLASVGDLADALAIYNRLEVAAPNLVTLYVNRALVQRALGEEQAARVDLRRAIEQINRLLGEQPQSANLYNMRGRVYSQLEEYDLARADFDRAIELAPKDPIHLMNRGISALDRAAPAEAEEFFTAALALDPAFAYAYFSRGTTRFGLGRLSEAITDLDRALELAPFFPEAAENRGLVKQALDDIPGAIADFDAAIAMSPQANTYENRAIAYTLIPKNEEALADFNRAIELEPKRASALSLRAVLLASLGKQTEARADVERALGVAADSALVHVYCGLAQLQLGDQDMAMTSFNRALELDPALLDARLQRARLYEQQGEFERAIEDLTVVLDKPVFSGNKSTAYRNRARLLAKQGRRDEALADYNQLIALIPTNPEYLNERGNLYLELSQLGEARADYERATRLQPDFASAYVNLGLVARRQNDQPGAIAFFDHALALDAENYPEAYVERGAAHIALRDWVQAGKDFERALELKPGLVSALYQRAYLRYVLDEPGAARADVEVVLALFPEDPDTLFLGGQIYNALCATAEARKAFDKLIAAHPEVATGYLHRSRTYGLEANYERALADVNEALRLQPDSAEALILRSSIHHYSGHAAERDADLGAVVAAQTRLIKLDPDDLAARYTRLLASARLGDDEQAVEDANFLIDHNGGEPQVFALRASIHLGKGAYDLAQADLRQALRLNPGEKQTLATSGLLALVEGDYEGAVATYTTLIGQSPLCPGPYAYRGLARQRLGEQEGGAADFKRAAQATGLGLQSLADGELYRERGQTALAKIELKLALALLPPASGEHQRAEEALRALETP